MTTTVPPVTETAAGSSSDRAPGPKRIVWLAMMLAVLVIGFLVPHVVTDTYNMSMFVDMALLGMLALSIGFLARHLGVISLGHVAFFGGSAYAVGYAINEFGWSPVAAFGFGVVVGTVLALGMALLVVRASGMGFLMLTLALSQALHQLALQDSFRSITGAHDGLPLALDANSSFFGLGASDLQNPGLFWPVAWTTLFVAASGLWFLGRSQFGTTLAGIRENEERMRFSGYDTFRPRIVAFVASGFVASIGGALFALNAGYVSPDTLSFTRAGEGLIAVLVGGVAVIIGPLLGTALFVWARGELNVGGNLELLTGGALVIVMVFLPGGITGTAQRLRKKLNRKDKSS